MTHVDGTCRENGSNMDNKSRCKMDTVPSEKKIMTPKYWLNSNCDRKLRCQLHQLGAYIAEIAVDINICKELSAPCIPGAGGSMV